MLNSNENPLYKIHTCFRHCINVCTKFRCFEFRLSTLSLKNPVKISDCLLCVWKQISDCLLCVWKFLSRFRLSHLCLKKFPDFRLSALCLKILYKFQMVFLKNSIQISDCLLCVWKVYPNFRPSALCLKILSKFQIVCFVFENSSVKYRLSARIDYRHPAYQLSACSLRTFLRDYPGKCLAITDRKSQIGFSAHAEANRKKSTTWSLRRRGEGRLSQTRSKMDDAKDVYEEKRLLGPFHGLTMSYEGSN